MGLLLLLMGQAAQAQTAAWQGVTDISGGPGRVVATVAAGSGYIYVVGAFGSTASFGGISLTGTGTSNLFVAKWNTATRQCVWARSAGGNGSNFTVRAVTASGNSVYVAGDFTGTAVFGSSTITSAGPSSVFIAKLTDAGAGSNFTWAYQAGNSTNANRVYGLAAQGNSVYLAGHFGGTATFGSLVLTATSTSGADAFVAKLTDAGATASFVWAQQLGGSGEDEVRAITAYGGAIYLAGYFQNTLVGWGNGLQAVGGSDGFVAKMTDAGTTAGLGWVSRIGGSGSEQALAVAATAAGVYVTGYFTSANAVFGPFTIANSGVASSADAFLLKLMDAGSTATTVWVQQSRGNSDELGSALAVQGTNVYMAGSFGNSQAGSIGASFGSVSLTNAGQRDVFVAKLPDVGTAPVFEWAQSAGGAGNDAVAALAIDGAGVHVGGYVVAPASFGLITLSSLSTSLTGFLASLTDPVLTASIEPATKTDFSVFPNPAHTSTTVVLPSLPSVTQATLSLTNVLGRTVYTQSLPLPATGATADLSLCGLAPGLYHVQVWVGKQQVARTLIVE